jgi:phage tail-like protein
MSRVLFVVAILALALPLASSAGRASAGPNSPQRFHVRVEIDGVAANFKKVEGLSFEQEVVEIPESQGGAIQHAPGPLKFHTFRLKRPYVGQPASEPVLDWLRAIRAGQNLRKSISVVILKSDNSPAARYTFLDCFLTGYSLTALDGDSDTECEETIEVHTAKSDDYLN